MEVLNVNQYNHDFDENISCEQEEMSREELRFMDIVASSVQPEDQHYKMKLPFKNDAFVLPNNRSVP